MHPIPTSFHPAVAEWFQSRFGAPTEPQLRAWPEIASGRNTLIAAPTGSGKTLAAFLATIDRLVWEWVRGEWRDETSVVYVSPLKALSNDIQKNLKEPLEEIRTVAGRMGVILPEIRTAVRTGDTPAGERAQMLKKPPHILITTPESLYLLLTSEKSRTILTTVRTVIVDEIHAMAKDKRGAHLALSLERLNRLTKRPLTRVGLSATQRPIEEIARFLVGTHQVDGEGSPSCHIIDAGHQRNLDLAIEVMGEEFSAVASAEFWSDVYDRVAALIREHRSTLVFVNTRRLVERVAHALAKRVGDETVVAHHGSLSKELRLEAETKLKTGRTRAVVATASLELGIDVGNVDLVCHIGSPRSLAVGLQRIGRAGHAPQENVEHLVVPKGRIFPVTRDELVECAAFVRGVRRGNLEKTSVMSYPLDILAQQIVAIVACEEIKEDDLFDLIHGAWPYAKVRRAEFDQIIAMLSEGFATSRGTRGAWLHRDRVTHTLRPRRGARLTAVTCGGAIPDNFNYPVVKEPEGIIVGSLEEDFAIESMAGDIFLLGNTSWRILRVETGRVRVEDAHGQPPTIPFWLGEAPGRSPELSSEVSDLRADLEVMLDHPEKVKKFLEEECGVPEAGACQIVDYLMQAKAALGALPTKKSLIAERFFDEGGGMQLIVHAPFGGRVNRAFGLALRKRFCAGFNFELQAAATDDGILLSLGPQHSFPLESVFDFVTPQNVQHTLEQAVLDAPVFGVRWRWNATRALVLLRQMGDKRTPPVIQRMRSDDLLAAAFPDQAACQENVTRPIKIPNHPLVTETMRNCLNEAMDLEGLEEVLRQIQQREIRLIAKDTPTPSPLSHEILNSNPYTFLDDAPLEERRARAVATRRTLSEDDLRAFGTLDEEVIAAVEKENWPDVRSVDELSDLLRDLVLIPQTSLPPEWRPWMKQLLESGRAIALGEHVVSLDKKEIAERGLSGDEEAVATILRGWMIVGGPATVSQWAAKTGLSEKVIDLAMLRLEAAGVVLRGYFRNQPQSGVEVEWCDRDVLARIHRRCLTHLKASIQPATTAEFVRYLMRWQHVAPGTQLHGAQGVAEIISQLQGLQLPAAAWEREILSARIANYDSSLLNELCLNGTVVWGRLLPGSTDDGDFASQPQSGVEGEALTALPVEACPPLEEGDPPRAGAARAPRRRSTPNRNTTISLMLREDRSWLLEATKDDQTIAGFTDSARALLDLFETRGAMFFNELQEVTGRLRTDLDQALWELVTAGAITCDGFAGLRNLIDPERRREKARLLSRYAGAHRPLFLGSGGRWSLLRPRSGVTESTTEKGPLGESLALENVAFQYLRRWGIIFRDLMLRESFSPPWRVLLNLYRRLEARGEIRGGRFVAGFAGEQFALPEAVEALRSARRSEASDAGVRINLSAADPLNLTGDLTRSPRMTATLANRVTFIGGIPEGPPLVKAV